MKTITKQELVEKLMNVKGSTFASVIAFVSVDVVKPKANGLDNGETPAKSGVKAVAKYLLNLNAIYGNSVESMALKEGKSKEEAEAIKQEVQPRAWGVHLTRSDGSLIPLVKNGEKFYLTGQVKNYLGKPLYYLRGKRIKASAILPFIRPQVKSSTQEDLEGEIKPRTISIDNIRVIAIKGEVYKIKGK